RERCERGEIPRFETRVLAAAEARVLTDDTGIRHRAYDRPSPFCGHWHVIRKHKHRGRPGSPAQNGRLRPWGISANRSSATDARVFSRSAGRMTKLTTKTSRASSIENARTTGRHGWARLSGYL